MIDEALQTLLTTASTITAVVGQRIYRGYLPEQAPLPSLVYDLTMTEYEESMEGSSGLAISRLQITAFGRTKIAARDLREIVRRVCQGFTGTHASTKIHTMIDWADDSIFEDEPEIWDASCQCNVWHEVPR